MAEKRTSDIDLDYDEEKVLTIKISLEGPAELVSWIRENTPGMVRKRLTGLVPTEFRDHMRAARREQMLAFRSLLDAMIGRMEREEKPSRRATKIEVE
jgi:hypothetical protein